jgi:putative transposase
LTPTPFLATLLAMARPVRLQHEAAVYHVTMRGNERRPIFRDDSDRGRFLTQLAQSVGLFAVRLYLYCLMTNHVHLVLGAPRANLSRFMQRLETAYTVYFNRRHHRCGHLFQGRFGSVWVDRDEHLLKLSRYVHLNPVFTRQVKCLSLKERLEILRGYPWSSYRSYVGYAKRQAFVEYGPVLSVVEPGPSGQEETFREFVEAGIENIDAAFMDTRRASRLCIGSDAFRDRVEFLYHRTLKDRPVSQDVSFRRSGRIVPVEWLVPMVCRELGVAEHDILRRRRNSVERWILARLLCRVSGLTQRQAAVVLGVHNGSAISVQMKLLDLRMSKNHRLADRITQMEEQLRQMCTNA